MKAKTTVWDAADYLEKPEDAAMYLKAAFESGDTALIAAALGDVTRAQGMTGVAREAGVSREALYKALSANGDPKLSTLLGVMHALGLRLDVSPSEKSAA